MRGEERLLLGRRRAAVPRSRRRSDGRCARLRESEQIHEREILLHGQACLRRQILGRQKVARILFLRIPPCGARAH